MELLLRRDEWGKIDTSGTLYVDGAYECRTLEDPVREVLGRPAAYWKEKGRTAIGAGRYRVVLQDSPRFGPNTMTLLGVEGFDYIRIHAGNDEEDTDGCPLVGGALEPEDDGSWRITGGTSGPALRALKAKVKAAIEAGEEAWITVKNPEAWEAANQAPTTA